MDLWPILSYFVESGREGRKVDLKRELSLETKPERARFAKDVMAMANTSGGTGYLIIGVVDLKDRTSTNPEDYVVGFAPTDRDEFERTMQQALDHYCHPPPAAHLEEMRHPESGKKLGIVVIPRSVSRPHVAKVEGEGLAVNDVYVRRESATFKASREELLRIVQSGASGALPCVLVSMSGRPISEAHLQQLHSLLGNTVDECIIVPSELDDSQPFEPQVREKVRQAGLTKEEWEQLPVVLNVLPLAPAAAISLAIVHGLKGCFPDVIRWRRVGSTAEFEVAEVARLRDIRDRARAGVY